jgi:phage-related protein
MCEDLKAALELQRELGTADTTKGAVMLFKAAATSMSKMSAAMTEHIKEADAKWEGIKQEIRELKESFEEYKTDAAKYRLIVEIFKALFGTTKRSIITLLYFAFIMGAIHIKDILPFLGSL